MTYSPSASERQSHHAVAWQTVIQKLVELDPDLTGWCFDASLARMECPAELARFFRHIGPPEGMTDSIVVDEDMPTLMNAWSKLRREGGSTCIARLGSDPTVPRKIQLMSLIPEFGVYVIMVGSQPATPEALEPNEAVDTRVGRMKVDIISTVLETDAGALQLLGYSEEELVGVNSTGYLHEEDQETAVAAWLEMLAAEGSTSRVVVRYRRKNGEYLWVEVTHKNLLETKGHIEREFIDFSDRMATILATERKEKIIDGLADVLPSAIAHFGADEKLAYCNARWVDFTGYDEAEQEDWATFVALVSDPDPKELTRELLGDLEATGTFSAEITLVSADDHTPRRCRLEIRSLPNESNGDGWIVCLDDVTEAWELQNRLSAQASRDALTGLANRGSIIEQLDRTLAAARESGSGTGVVFLDLNGFKRVNDVLGHSVGDALLQHVGSALSNATRPTDTAGRHGGDEFIVVCRDVAGPEDALRLAQRLLDGVTGRFAVDGETVDCSASCGVAFDRGGVHSAERLIAEADLAMYEQKRAGGQDPGLFRARMLDDQRGELTRDSALRRALADDTLELWYQPLVNLITREIVGYEALLRWRFEGRIVSPVDFIGLAERRGLIGDIGAWVVDEVTRVAAADPRRDLLWTLNVSPVQLRDTSFDMLVASALNRHQLPASQLGLELTEGVLAAENEEMREVLARLVKSGVEVFIDDFGTGHASLDSLRTLPVSGIKIDPSFTQSIVGHERSKRITKATISLARQLELRVFIEGIETAAQAAGIVELGAEFGQGYLFGRPTSDGHLTTRADESGGRDSETRATPAVAPVEPPVSLR